MTKQHEGRTRLAQWWAVVTLWLAIVMIAFSAVGCAPASSLNLLT